MKEEPVLGLGFAPEAVVEASAPEFEVADGPPIMLPAGLAVILPML
jgi:hypothetical protein